ncbi:MAG TPA: PAS domain S-box protein [Candidatus Xenobia bacterium]|jgi:hypothetical protein
MLDEADLLGDKSVDLDCGDPALEGLSASDIERLKALAEGERLDLDVQVADRWYELRVVRIDRRLRGTLRDITRRMEEHEELLDANQMLAAIIVSSPIAIVTLDFDGLVKSWNPAAEKVFGWTEQEVVGKPNPIVPMRKREEFKAYFDKVLTGEALSRVEVRRERKDGQYIELSVTTAPFRNMQGEVHGMIGVLADITERKRAGEQRETVAIISRLFLDHDDIHDIYRALPQILSTRFQFPVVAITLHQGEVLRIVGSVGLPGENDIPVQNSLSGVCLQSGQPVVESDASTRPEYVGTTLEQLGVKTFMSIPMKFGERVLGTVTLADTKRIEIQPSLVDAVQVIANYLAAAIDRNRAEEEVRQLNASLERRVAERTAELQDANRELESFSYSVSHDLRAPLRAIDGFSRILLEDHAEQLDAEGQRVVNVVINNTRKMGQLIDDLLAFSRLGRKAVEGNMVSVEELAGTIFEELKFINPKRHVALTLPQPLPRVWADAAMLRQVLVNLLSNAIKFTGKKPEAYIELGWQADDGLYRFWVKDNGAGFDMAYASKLFGVFQRLHKPSDFEGTGVGLAIVQRIVTKHGGRIWAESKINEGATFFFTWPSASPSE